MVIYAHTTHAHIHNTCSHTHVQHEYNDINLHNTKLAEKIPDTESVPKTNTVSERDLTQLDRFLREKPNATTVALENLNLFSNKKTGEWLQQKNDEQKVKIFASATTTDQVQKVCVATGV